MADVACEEYASTLRDLTFNSKPHISMLTMLAEENQQYAPKIVQAIEAHLQKVRPETKLPAIYLIDSIVKNVGGDYLALFTQNLVSTFCSVFEKVDERTRIQLFKLRQTWSDVFPTKKLHAIDVRVRQMDPAWPVVQQASIHVNPKFLKTAVEEDTKNNQEIQEAEMRKQLIAKQQELLKLQQQKLELELLQTKAKLQEQKKLLHPPADPLQPVPIIKPIQCVEEPPPIRKIVMEPPKPHIPPPVKSAIVMPPRSSIPGPSTRPQSVVIPTKDPRLMRDPRLLRDSRSSFHAALVPVNAGAIPAVPVINNRNNEKMVEKAHVNLNVLSNHVPRSGNERGVPSRETVKSAVVVQPARSVERKDDPPSVKNDKTPKKKPEKETKKCSPKSNVKLANMSTVKEVTKKDTKKKNETPSPKKIVPHKKDELLKEKVDKPKPIEKNKKAKVEGKVALDPLRERKGSGRNSAGRSSVRPAHEYKNEDFSGKGNNRARRNYRTNRNRSDSPDTKLGRQLKAIDKDNTSTLEKDRSVVRARSRSPLRPDRANERDDKRAERSSEKEEKKKKGPRTEIENINSGVADKDTQSAGLKDLNTDVDLRTINPNSPKHTDKSMNSDVDAKENVDTSSAAEEPPPKKLRQDEAQLDTLFGSKDQDYRQMPPNSEIGVPELESPGNRGWAQYKAEHPEEFKCSTPRPLKESVQREPYGFSSFDQDFRTSVRDDDYYPQVVESEQQPKFSGFQRGRNRRGFPPNQPRMRGFGRGRYPGRHVDDPRVLRRHPVYQRLYSQQENTMDPNLDIPHALLLSKQAEILKQADQQLKSGHLSREQHHELLNQLGKLYELQTLRQKQKEEELREKIFLRNDIPRRDCPPWQSESSYTGGPRFPPDSGNKHFAAVQDPSTGIDPYQKKLNRRHMRHKMMKSRQSEVLDSVAAELEHVQRSSQSGEVSRLDATKEATPIKEEASLTEARQTEPHFRNITIDGKQMRLMFYGTVAVVLSDSEPPREITFKGRLQEVYVDEVTIPLGFGGDTVIAEVDGKPHSFKFGAPTEEIFIDNIPHAIQFGGPPKPIFLGGKQRLLRLSGPAPDVEFAKLRPALQGEVTKLLQLEGKLRKEKAAFGSNDTKSKGTNVPCEEPRTAKAEVDERPKVKVENPDAASKPAPPLIDVEPKKPERVPEQVEVKELVVKDDASKATVREAVPEPDKARDLHNPDPKLFEEIPVKNEKCDVDLRITEPLETAPKPSTSTHRASPIPVPAVASVADSERVGRTASPSHFVDASSRSPVYHGSFANVSRPDYHEFRAVHSEEGDKDYRDIRTFSQVDSMVFKEEPMEPKFAPQDKPHDPWPEPWRENTRMYHDVPVFKSEHPQAGGYGQHEPPPHRDEYVPEYWPPHRREEEFQGKPRFFRERRSRQNSPQRVQPEYPPFRDSGPLPLPHDGGMHRDFPLYRPNPNMGNRVDNVRPHFEPLRPPFELPGARYDMPRPRFETPIRPSLGERGPILQPPLSFYPSGPTNIQRPGFPEQRPEFFQPMTDRTNFAPVSNVFPAGTPINQGGLPSVPPPPVVPPPPPSVPQPFVLPPQLDVAELFKKLVTAGIISKSTSTTSTQENASDSTPDTENKENVEVAEVEEEKIPHIEFTSESLRTHYSGVISNLFRGIQCSSCGLRFTSDQTEKYAQHLDWHFRQNRRERDGAKKAVSRKWYYDVQDWIQFEEIEDMEERARSLFEVQANEEIVEHIDDLHTVPVGENDEDNTCVVCGEPFEQFWDQEKEEWHLRDSFRVENKTYHPGCYEDIKNVALTEPSSEAVPPEKPVCVSWQDMPDKKKTDEKKKTEEKKPAAPEDKTAAVSVVKIKQEKTDVAELEEPTEPMEVDIPEAVVIKHERDLDTVAAVSGPSEISFTNEPPVAVVSGTSSEQLSIKTTIPTPHPSVPLNESLAVELLTTQPSESLLVEVVQGAVMPSDETSAAAPPLEVANVVPPYEGTAVASPGEAMVVVPPNETVAFAPFGESTMVKSPDGAVTAAPPDEASRVEPPDEAMADAPPEGSGGVDLPLQLPSEDNPPVDLSSAVGLLPVAQVTTDSSPVDEMQRLQVKVEPEVFTSLLSTSETAERNVELEANSTSSLETNSMHSSTIKQQLVENDERTLSPRTAVQIKQEPVEHEEVTPSEPSVDRTKAEIDVQKPHSPVGDTIEKVLEGSCEVESSVEDTVAPTPGFTVFPPVMRGTELSGLCSIM